jgi:hypothetical protein
VPKKGGYVIPNRVLKGLIENLTVRCNNNLCRDPDNEPDRQRRRLNPGEVTATHDACTRIGKLVDWPAHSKSECTLETVSCTVVGCDFRCERKGSSQHTTDNAMEHLRLMVSVETEKLRSDFAAKILAFRAEHDSQVQAEHDSQVQAEHDSQVQIKFVHAQLSSFCRKWMERKPDALFDFVVYTAAMWCSRSKADRVGRRAFPVLIIWNSDPHLPPKCKYPKCLLSANVNSSSTLHADLSFPEMSWQRKPN